MATYDTHLKAKGGGGKKGRIHGEWELHNLSLLLLLLLFFSAACLTFESFYQLASSCMASFSHPRDVLLCGFDRSYGSDASD